VCPTLSATKVEPARFMKSGPLARALRPSSALSLHRRCGAALSLAWIACSASGAGGPLGIDSTVGGDATGIFRRNNQLLLQDLTPLVVLGSALWSGDGTRFGHASWQSVDSLLIGTVTAASMKPAFGRSRPSQTTDPNQWFRGRGNNSFPSGEVMEITTAVTPYVLEYGADHPAVWALELLPLYDSVARVKSHAHWQSDALASFAIGTGIGWYTHSRPSSLTVGVLPHGLTVGWSKAF
jgi:membrane-associated phospholipid phosphatase